MQDAESGKTDISKKEARVPKPSKFSAAILIIATLPSRYKKGQGCSAIWVLVSYADLHHFGAVKFMLE